MENLLSTMALMAFFMVALGLGAIIKRQPVAHSCGCGSKESESGCGTCTTSDDCDPSENTDCSTSTCVTPNK